MMHSSNRQCNTFQSAVGVFLQSCNAPETLRELLAHMGVSVATRDAEVRFRTGPKTPEPPNRTEVRFRFRFGLGLEVSGPVLVQRLGEFFEPGSNPFGPEPSSFFTVRCFKLS